MKSQIINLGPTNKAECVYQPNVGWYRTCTCSNKDYYKCARPERSKVMSTSSLTRRAPALTWRRPFPAARSRTRCPRPSGRTAASRPSPAAGRRSPPPPTRRTARTAREKHQYYICINRYIYIHSALIPIGLKYIEDKRRTTSQTSGS